MDIVGFMNRDQLYKKFDKSFTNKHYNEDTDG